MPVYGKRSLTIVTDGSSASLLDQGIVISLNRYLLINANQLLMGSEWEALWHPTGKLIIVWLLFFWRSRHMKNHIFI